MAVGIPRSRLDASGRYDAIVVGSGMGGLVTAAMLSRHARRRVLVLERHWTAGGFTHVFRRPGYEWDVGLHYVGDVQSTASPLRRMFDHVSDGRLEWASMGEVYDRIVIGEDAYDLRAGAERFREDLTRRFPGEACAIDQYLATLRAVARAAGLFFAEKAVPGAVSALFGGVMRRRFLRHARCTTREVLAGMTANRRLASVLTAQYGDYGLPPGQSSFVMHAMLARHYLRGGSYPVGGAAALAAGVAPLVEECGGQIVVGAEVERILVEGERAVGVRLADGEELRAPIVVSNAGVHNTFLRLLPRQLAARHGLEQRARSLEASLAHVCLYLGLRESAEQLGLPKHNLWLYPGEDHDASIAAFLHDPDAAPLPLVYVSFPSAKDPDFARRHPGRATIEVITLGPWRAFAAWADRPWRRRGGAYEALKRRYAERLLEALYRHVPQVRGKLDHVEVSTPLSTRQFAGYGSGEIYGLAHTPARFEARWLRPRTEIAGLYLTGQDVVTCGIAGALAAGVLTASVITGRNLMAKAARGVTS